MKKIDKSETYSSTYYFGNTIFLNNIKEIVKILSGYNLYISDGDYEYASIDELVKTYDKNYWPRQLFIHGYLKIKNEYYPIVILSLSSFRIWKLHYHNVGNDYLKALEVKKILRSKSYFSYKGLRSLLNVLILEVTLMVAIIWTKLTSNNFNFAETFNPHKLFDIPSILTLLASIGIVILFFIFGRSIVLINEQNNISFFNKNRDKIIVAAITFVITSVLNYLLQLAFRL